MPTRDLVVIGGSAGSVVPMRAIFADLPADLPAAVLVVAHMPPVGRSALAHILDRAGQLPVAEARDGEPIDIGRAYVAVPDRHLLIDHETLRLSDGPRENGTRPCVDALFRSAARWYGPRAIGIVLSGALHDGAAGLAAIAAAGGVTIVQDPADAMFDSMPRAALAVAGRADVLPGGRLGASITQRVGGSIEDPHESAGCHTATTTDIAAEGKADLG